MIVLSIRIKNMYDERGAAPLRRNQDEANVIENQVEMANQFLCVVSKHVYAVGGDVIQYKGDRITACLSGESENQVMGKKPSGDKS